ncbi:MAG TPA: O-antigen ligase family protein [Solirubrobacteraceae bacterium]|nr:O-antigen ligase family protein [Solirubrobacteraceae bacterium]
MTTSEAPPRRAPAVDAGRRQEGMADRSWHVGLPGVLTAFLAFASGGFFPGQVAAAAAVLAVVLLLRLTLARRPLEGWSPGAAAVAFLAALLAGWTLFSAVWSDAPARALHEFDRMLLYLLAFGVMACFPRRPSDLATVLRWVLAAIVVVAAAALATRLLPGVFEAVPGREPARLAHPLTYWNALSVLCALGLVLAVHAASGEREPAAVRVLAGAAIPILVVAGYFPLSRGGIATAVVGLLLYALLARPRRLPVVLLTAGPPAVVALVSAYGAEALATATYYEPPGPDEGREVLVVLVAAVAAAALLRALALPLERRLDALPRPGRRARVLGTVAAGVLALAAMGAGWVAFDGSERVRDQYDAFVRGNVVDPGLDTRRRLSAAGNNGRLDVWRVGRDTFTAEPLHGAGAGTFQLAWERERPVTEQVVDGHSLYLETAAELGVVGLVLLALTLAGLLAGAARGVRGPERHPRAALLAAAVALLLHAGIDWDWEMTALFAWLFAAAGTAWACPVSEATAPRGGPARLTRVLTGLGCLVLALTPVLVMTSQSRLDAAARSFERGDCGAAVDAALDSVDALPVRAEPFELIGYCDLRAGEAALGVSAFEAAGRRDPDSWRYAYGLALARALDGRDPRPAIAEARRLNPLEPRVRDLAVALSGDRPAAWRRAARRAPLPF